MKFPKLKAPKVKMPKVPKALQKTFKQAGKSAQHLPAEKVAVHALGHLAGHLLEQVVTNPPA